MRTARKNRYDGIFFRGVMIGGGSIASPSERKLKGVEVSNIHIEAFLRIHTLKQYVVVWFRGTEQNLVSVLLGSYVTKPNRTEPNRKKSWT